ncbi:MAG: hypothetical protein MUP97_06760 [Acidimicrobiia bacterium]|nr:hypothetical protein [Acidimicrobiia bacterium]
MSTVVSGVDTAELGSWQGEQWYQGGGRVRFLIDMGLGQLPAGYLYADYFRRTRNVVVALAYDTARVAIQGIANARIPTPRHVKEGIEMIKWMPARTGARRATSRSRSTTTGATRATPHHSRAARWRTALPGLLPPAVADQHDGRGKLDSPGGLRILPRPARIPR